MSSWQAHWRKEEPPAFDAGECQTGVLAPYLAAQETYSPHLTVGRCNNAAIFAEALKEAQHITTAFETEVREICVYRIEQGWEKQVECKVQLS